MFDTKKYTQSRFVKGADLVEGERVVLTIKSAEEQTFEQSGDTVPCLSFLEIDQGLTLNRTRIAKLVEMFGEETEEWVGQRIAIYPVPVTFQGKSTMGVAVGKAPSRAKARVSVDNDVEFEQPAKRKAAPVAVVEDDDNESPF